MIVYANRIKAEVNNLIDFYEDRKLEKPVGICFLCTDSYVMDYLSIRFPDRFYLANGKEISDFSIYNDEFEHYRFADIERINFLTNILNDL
jgi:hypothetical protein